MTTLHTAARQALEALEDVCERLAFVCGEKDESAPSAVGRAKAAALRAALEAQQEPKPHTIERHFALREGLAIGAADAYFKVWPIHDNDAGRMLFERGFVRGFDAGEKVYAHPPAQPQGWVLVPEEPTPWMCAAGVQALCAASVGDIETAGSEARITYIAMLAARPQPKETT